MTQQKTTQTEKKTTKTGVKLTRSERIRKEIHPEALKSHWQDWKWQVKHAVTDIDTFERVLGIQFEPEHRKQLVETLDKFPLSATPYYLSLIDPKDYKNDPIFKQAFPMPFELTIAPHDMSDPLHEDADSPATGITHRYPDRVLFHVSNVCAMYCRHCTRKRKVGDVDSLPSRADVEKGLEYIRNTPQVRDVLLSGGDPFLMREDYLDWILTELRKIDHVEIIRIGTRTPVVLPQRITPELTDMLRKHHPIWINTHFNHPREFTDESRRALARLADAGIPLGNQTVLLAGVNDCPRLMRSLVHKLVYNRVRPYYLYQCDLSEGLTHFRTPVGKGIEIIESLIGHTSGLAVPTYVIDAPGGGGKIPIMPNYLISWSTNKVVLRNYEGVITTYSEPDSYPAIDCDRKCDACKLDLPTSDSYEHDPVGISSLLEGREEDDISLVPQDNERLSRRESEGE
ncbi:MAG: lysine 2,3-aminomutase [Phycisphaerae bacterium]